MSARKNMLVDRAPRDREGKAVYRPYIDIADNLLSRDDIRHGIPLVPGACPYAVSCVRQIVDVIHAEVGRTYTFLEYPDHWLKLQTSKAMLAETTVEDRGGRMAPGEFTLKALSPSQRAPRKQGKTRGAGGGNPKPRRHVVGVRGPA